MRSAAHTPSPAVLAPLLEAKDLVRIFDVSSPWLERRLNREPRRLLRAVDKVSLGVVRGETFGLVGESGSGKTTLAKMIVGLVRPTSGRVLFDGVDLNAAGELSHNRPLRRRLAMVFQDPYASLNPRMTARAIIAEPLRAFGQCGSDEACAARVAELLTLVGLSPGDAAKYPHQFSGGQRQRVAIARALAGHPDFIICDEPTSSLDVSVQAQILNLMSDLQQQFQLTYLLISHNLAIVRHMASRIGVMYLGRLVEVAASDMLFLRPRHPYTRMLIDAVPDIAARRRERVSTRGEIADPINPPPGCAFHPRCPLAVARCRIERPELRGAGGAEVACHLA
jgi:peptide/nickel transport system ATP-binding protein